MRNKHRKYTEEEFRKAVEESFSVREVLKKLSLIPAGGNYSSFHKRVEELNINTSHFTGQGHLLGRTHNWNKPLSLDDVMVEHSTYCRTKLKKRLIKNGILKTVCSTCGISEWNGKEISLHLEHINGVNNDNRIENLCLLCPNCHSQTDTYAGKNKRRCSTNAERMKAKTKSRISRNTKLCCDCGKKIDFKSVRCKSCNGFVNVPTKIEWPAIDTLIEMVEASSYLAVGKELKVSDNAVRKHIKRHGNKSNRSAGNR